MTLNPDVAEAVYSDPDISPGAKRLLRALIAATPDELRAIKYHPAWLEMMAALRDDAPPTTAILLDRVYPNGYDLDELAAPRPRVNRVDVTRPPVVPTESPFWVRGLVSSTH